MADAPGAWPPGTGKTHLATGIATRACQAGHRVAFATASQRVDRLAAAHASGKLAGRARPPRTMPAADYQRGRLHPVLGSVPAAANEPG